jgi:hypothetical protein
MYSYSVAPVADPGFLKGGFWYTPVREARAIFYKPRPLWGKKTTPISIVFETNYQPYQYYRSVFERIFF